jgi:hypothetical protein
MVRRQKPTKNMALENFRFSLRWLEGFKKKYTLVKRDSHGQRDDVDIPLHTPRFEEIAQELLANDPSNIYNCDETVLYLKGLSTRTLSQGKVMGRKPNTDARVSVLLCCNADGSDKRRPLVLCKYTACSRVCSLKYGTL